MTQLTQLIAREVLDSRGRPTVEVEAVADNGARGIAIVPSGASTGKHEALEKRDGDPQRYRGLGVLQAVNHVTSHIESALRGMALADQIEIDTALIALDGTPNKSRLGANAILGVSLAVAHAAARARGEELFVHLNRLWNARLGPQSQVSPVLPMPMVNMISGGKHAGQNLEFQDILAIPIGARSYPEALETVVEVYRALGDVLRKRGEEADLVGDEGGYGPKLNSNAVAIERVVEAIEQAGRTPGQDVAIALDVAASHFYQEDSATYTLSAGALGSEGMVEFLAGLVERYPIVSIEDGLAEDDWRGWTLLTQALGSRVQLIGDDLFTTQTARIQRGIDQNAGNAVLIKLNQVGTLTETLDALALARSAGMRAVVSARSGETEDATIADLAVGTAAGQIKIGSIVRSERLAKYNRLSRIAEAIPAFAGWHAAHPPAPP